MLVARLLATYLSKIRNELHKQKSSQHYLVRHKNIQKSSSRGNAAYVPAMMIKMGVLR